MKKALDKAMSSLGAIERKGRFAEFGFASWLVPYHDAPPRGYLSSLVVTSTLEPKLTKKALAERLAKLRRVADGNEYQALQEARFYAIERDEWVDFMRPITRETIGA